MRLITPHDGRYYCLFVFRCEMQWLLVSRSASGEWVSLGVSKPSFYGVCAGVCALAYYHVYNGLPSSPVNP